MIQGKITFIYFVRERDIQRGVNEVAKQRGPNSHLPERKRCVRPSHKQRIIIKEFEDISSLVFIKVLLTDLVLPSFMYANGKAWFSLATKKCNRDIQGENEIRRKH